MIWLDVPPPFAAASVKPSATVMSTPREQSLPHGDDRDRRAVHVHGRLARPAALSTWMMPIASGSFVPAACKRLSSPLNFTPDPFESCRLQNVLEAEDERVGDVFNTDGWEAMVVCSRGQRRPVTPSIRPGAGAVTAWLSALMRWFRRREVAGIARRFCLRILDPPAHDPPGSPGSDPWRRSPSDRSRGSCRRCRCPASGAG